MKNKLIFLISGIGVILAFVSAYIYSIEHKALPPAFSPASNPFGKGIYAEGIVESYQTNGKNINIYPEVSGTVRQILVAEGQAVQRGAPLFVIDDTVQRATVEQQKSQAEAALALLNELKAQPRKENLKISIAQVELAKANLKNALDSLDKQQKSYELDPKSVSKDVLDSAINAAKVAQANLDVAVKQYDLTKAGAWIYDIKNQEKQYEALIKAYTASSALLDKYTIKAPDDGVILSVDAAVGGYVSPQGIYDSYTQGFDPSVVMGGPQGKLGLRCYIDEILVHQLPSIPKMHARMFIRGTDINIPLEYVRVQPYVSPKIELSDQRLERVDVRVLPVIFKFDKPKDINLYPGQLVDVYIEAK